MIAHSCRNVGWCRDVRIPFWRKRLSGSKTQVATKQNTPRVTASWFFAVYGLPFHHWIREGLPTIHPESPSTLSRLVQIVLQALNLRDRASMFASKDCEPDREPRSRFVIR